MKVVSILVKFGYFGNVGVAVVLVFVCSTQHLGCGAAGGGGIIATVPIKDRVVHCALDNEADPERPHAIDIVGGQIATLVDK